MLSSEDKILTKTCGNLEDFLPSQKLRRQTVDDFLRKLRISSSIERTAEICRELQIGYHYRNQDTVKIKL